MRQESVDPGLLRMAGEAYLASGNPTKAADVYERANALDKANRPSSSSATLRGELAA